MEKCYFTFYILCSFLSLFDTIKHFVWHCSLEFTANKSLATLPVVIVSIGAVLLIIPVSILIRKLGAKRTFMLDTTLGIITGLLSPYSIIEKSFSLFILGNMLVGCY